MERASANFYRGGAYVLIVSAVGAGIHVRGVGRQIESWMLYQSLYDVRPYVVVLARIVRWLLALTTSVAVLAVIYHMGTPRTQSWRRILPGSILATHSGSLPRLPSDGM